MFRICLKILPKSKHRENTRAGVTNILNYQSLQIHGFVIEPKWKLVLDEA